MASPATPTPSRLEAACAALNPVPSFEFDLDVFKNIILERTGTKDQRATLLRILSQHKPAKGNLALKLAHALSDTESKSEIANRDHLETYVYVSLTNPGISANYATTPLVTRPPGGTW